MKKLLLLLSLLLATILLVSCSSKRSSEPMTYYDCAAGEHKKYGAMQLLAINDAGTIMSYGSEYEYREGEEERLVSVSGGTGKRRFEYADVRGYEKYVLNRKNKTLTTSLHANIYYNDTKEWWEPSSLKTRKCEIVLPPDFSICDKRRNGEYYPCEWKKGSEGKLL